MLDNTGTPIIYYYIISFLKDKKEKDSFLREIFFFLTLNVVVTQISLVIMVDIADTVGALFISR